MKKSLMDMEKQELAALLKGWGEPPYRAGQVYGWLMRGMAPAGMTNISKTLRECLSIYPWGGATIEKKFLSEKDGTVKYLFAFEDGALAEGVLMRYHHGNTLCLSTQVGCRMGCAFCASTLEGLYRNLTAGEMLGEVLAAERDEKAEQEGSAGPAAPTAQRRAITNLVLMGSGEPLDNYDNTVAFLRRAVSPEGLGISARNISLSTCGIVPAIERLALDAPPITLCISLHAHEDSVRSELMPINQKYPMQQVLEAAGKYAKMTGRRVIFEYALIEGQNDSRKDAAALSDRIKGMPSHVNAIPLNPVQERDLRGASRKHAEEFVKWLIGYGVSASVRRELGTDIEGACGQLRRRVMQESSE